MARAGTSLTADAIRIDDEVWQEAFQTRVPSRRRALERDRAVVAPEPSVVAPVAAAGPRVSASARPGPVAAAGSTVAAGRVAARPAAAPVSPERRTIKIQGRGAERGLPWSGETARRRPPRALHERAGFRPDRLAMWAVFLGLLLVLVAALSGHG